jgi:hypothetical protein
MIAIGGVNVDLSTWVERRIAAIGYRDYLLMTWEGTGWALGVSAERARQIYKTGLRSYGVQPVIRG